METQNQSTNDATEETKIVNLEEKTNDEDVEDVQAAVEIKERASPAQTEFKRSVTTSIFM